MAIKEALAMLNRHKTKITGAVLGTIHNLHYYLSLMGEMREAIAAGTFAAWAESFYAMRAAGVPE